MTAATKMGRSNGCRAQRYVSQQRSAMMNAAEAASAAAVRTWFQMVQLTT